MSNNQYGLPLTEPVTQTLLPIVMPSGRVYGFFPIQSTEFDGTETTFALSEGPVPITTVTVAPKNYQNNSYQQRVPQYVAAQWPSTVEQQAPWRGYTELITVDQPNNIGFYSWWSMPVAGWFHHFGQGVLLNSLQFSMSNYVYVPPSASLTAVTTPQALTWATTANAQSFVQDCAFFDFNWVELFQAQFQSDPSVQGSNVIPLSIAIASNPAGGFFKASVLQSMNGQVIYPGGGAVFNTIRILRLQDPTAGLYTFNFTISANINGVIESVPAVLNLTVV